MFSSTAILRKWAGITIMAGTLSAGAKHDERQGECGRDQDRQFLHHAAILVLRSVPSKDQGPPPPTFPN